MRFIVQDNFSIRKNMKRNDRLRQQFWISSCCDRIEHDFRLCKLFPCFNKSRRAIVGEWSIKQTIKWRGDAIKTNVICLNIITGTPLQRMVHQQKSELLMRSEVHNAILCFQTLFSCFLSRFVIIQ